MIKAQRNNVSKTKLQVNAQHFRFAKFRKINIMSKYTLAEQEEQQRKSNCPVVIFKLMIVHV